MKVKILLPALLCALVLGAGSAMADPQTTAAVPSGGSVLIDGRARESVTVELQIVGWDKNQVAVDQTYEKNNGAHVVPKIEQDGKTTKIVPSGDGVRQSYFFGLIPTGGTTLKWVVHVPSAVPVTANSGNSGLEVRGVRGPLTVRTSNGGVNVADAGPLVDVQTSNGGIGVSIATLDSQAPQIRIRTSNGGVSLRVPHDFHTRVTTQTWNGGTTNPFADASGPGSASIATSNGGIDITGTP